MKSLILTFSFISLFACKQQQSENSTNQESKQRTTMQNVHINPKYNDITATNFKEKILESVKHYPNEPMYYMRIGKANCLIEVLVNDYLIFESYELSNQVTPEEINHGILKSGKQKLTYRLYPIGDLMKENYGDDNPTVTTLTDLTSVNISIIQMDNKGEKKLKDEVVVKEHNSLTDKNGNFIASGKPYYEYTFEFDATVPYELEGWTNGQDLAKLDQKLLEKKAIEAYKDYGAVILSGNENQFAKLHFGLEKRIANSLYREKESINQLYDELFSQLREKNMKIIPIKDYRKVFFGEGKIVFLLNKSLEGIYRGSSALELEYIDDEGDECVNMPRVMLYLPQGKKLEDGLYMIE